MSLYLGIDTSNYTTSVALIGDGGEIINKKRLLPVREGALGLRQSDAVFHHTQQLWELFDEALDGIEPRDIRAIGASSRPRPVEGSYMPCFTVGLNSAHMLSDALEIPLYTFSHQEGHIAAAILSCGREELFERGFLAFHVSGGTTEAVLARPHGDGFELEIAAKTLDLNAGQAIDRAGLMLGLKFPCGAELEKLALDYKGDIKVRPTLKGCDCCLSGLENQCRKMIEDNSSKEKTAYFCIKYIEAALTAMTDRLLEKHGKLPLLYAGGVMSNSIIRGEFERRYGAYFAQPEFSSDNAAGIAYLTQRKAKNV